MELVVKNPPANAGDVSSIPGQGIKIPPAATTEPAPQTERPVYRHEGSAQPKREDISILPGSVSGQHKTKYQEREKERRLKKK